MSLMWVPGSEPTHAEGEHANSVYYITWEMQDPKQYKVV